MFQIPSQASQQAANASYRLDLRQQMKQSEQLNQWAGSYAEALKTPEPLRSIRGELAKARVEEKRLLAAKAALES